MHNPHNKLLNTINQEVPDLNNSMGTALSKRINIQVHDNDRGVNVGSGQNKFMN